jgi:hypothetical protein
LDGGQIVKLSGQNSKKLNGSGAIVATTAVLLTPLALFIPGKGAKFEAGTVFDAYVARDTEIKKSTRKGEDEDVVSRDNPGNTDLERTIIRWTFDSDPRGSRIFWRVISSVPDAVKNTNETYLTTTPYEETRSFNILGLTYENSRDVTVEIKLSKKGYHDQVKRYNVRQAIDQQEISGFFDMVEDK